MDSTKQRNDEKFFKVLDSCDDTGGEVSARKLSRLWSSSGLTRISESTENLHLIEIVMVKPMKQKGHVPELTPSVQDGSEVRVSLIRNQDMVQNDADGSETSSVSEGLISSELQDLRNRAKKLSEDLKSLSKETESIKAATTCNDIGTDGNPIDKQSEEIKEIMKRYSDIIDDDNVDLDEEHVRRIVRKSLEPESQGINENDDDSNATEALESFDKSGNEEKIYDDDKEHFNEMIDEALNEIRNFVPKRKRQEKPTFVDLSVEDEKYLRVKNRGAPYYWHMPFRHNLYLKGRTSNDDNSSDDEGKIEDNDKLVASSERASSNESLASQHEDEERSGENKSALSDSNATKIKQSSYNFKKDPCVFAPTGDIYSYLNRRPMLSASARTFQYPFRYSTIQALS